MPTNKNAQLRYQILDRCFSNFYHRYSIEDLLDEVNMQLEDLYGEKACIKLRQLREDIKIMRDSMGYNAPIKAYPGAENGKECYYRYSDRNFSIFNTELSVQDVDKLRSTIEMLGRFRGLPNNDWLEEAINSLECKFGLKAKTEELVSFDHNDKLQGLKWLSFIIDATTNHQPLDIAYQPYGQKEEPILLHPYYVKQYNNRWFVFGLSIDKNGNRNISNKALDRMNSIHHANVPFVPNTTIDFSTYFDNIIGVSVPQDPEVKIEAIILRFTEKRFHYIETKPMHSSQEIVGDNTISIKVYPTRELWQQIFSFGPDVEVLAPRWLRDEFREKIKENLQKYSDVQKECTEEK